MASPAQLAANRENAQLSTGPRTEAGRARSSANALVHGFSSQTVILMGEDPDEYEDLLTDLLLSFPTGGHFALDRAVREMANAEWRLRRVRRHMELALNTKMAQLQSEIPASSPLELQARAFDILVNESKSFKLLMRYETRFENLYSRAQRDWMTCYRLLNPVETMYEAITRQAPDWLRSATPAAPPAAGPGATPRNSLCHCGSGQKYKRCCGRNAPPVLTRASRG
ncbi:MAG: SEC-C domain-containing protein [Bryobacterales bacterium]|nr:SEC-C domain-containing protein [Bryobacterales bacterium]